jgi:hypothetical protein
MQGRHILFLAGPAFATLFVGGLSFVICHLSLVTGRLSTVGDQLPLFTHYALRTTSYALLALLLTAATAQLLFMQGSYPPLLPVRTTPLAIAALRPLPEAVSLPGGSRLLGYQLEDEAGAALRVSLWWQAGDDYAPEDYQLELNLLDEAGQVAANWLGYQTQARYPTRAWEPGDTVRDDGWLPLVGLPPGPYTLRWRLLGQTGELLPWQILTNYQLDQFAPAPDSRTGWVLWHNGLPTSHPSLLSERQTAQFTQPNPPIFQSSSLQLFGPDNLPHLPSASGPNWANFIIDPDWPRGDYRLSDTEPVVLRLADNRRTFSLPEIWQPLDLNFAGKIKLLGYNLPSRRGQAGDGFPITLFWQGLEEMGQEFVIFTRLLDNRQVAWGGYDRLARENYSTLLWAPGEIISDGFAVPVAADAPDGVYWLSVGWYAKADAEAKSLPLLDAETGQPLDLTSVMIGPLKVGGPPPGLIVPQAHPSTSVNVELGDQINLMGYDMVIDRVESAQNLKSKIQNLKLTFYWQALRQPDADYTVFVHVRDDAGNVIAQKDQPLLGGAYPTSLWDAGEIIKDEISLPLDGVAPGRYQIVVGLYDLDTGERLRLSGRPDDFVELIDVRLGQNGTP